MKKAYRGIPSKGIDKTKGPHKEVSIIVGGNQTRISGKNAKVKNAGPGEESRWGKNDTLNGALSSRIIRAAEVSIKGGGEAGKKRNVGKKQ